MNQVYIPGSARTGLRQPLTPETYSSKRRLVDHQLTIRVSLDCYCMTGVATGATLTVMRSRARVVVRRLSLRLLSTKYLRTEIY